MAIQYPYYNTCTLKCDPICVNYTCGTYSMGLGDSSDSVTIIIVSVITTVLVKNYYHGSSDSVTAKATMLPSTYI